MKKEISQLLAEVISNLKKANNWPDFDISQINVEFSKNEKFGDYSTNIAMVLSRILGKDPLEISEKIKKELLQQGVNKNIDKIDVMNPGYINFYLSNFYFSEKIQEINKLKEEYGNGRIKGGEKINLEFISANPTGPIHLGNARGGPIGDALGNVLEKIGYSVEREYYINDFGNQVEILGHSILKDEKAEYKGEYIDDLVRKLGKTEKNPLLIGNYAAEIIVREMIKPVCKKFGINFDNWFSEKSLHETGEVDAIIKFLEEKNLAFKKDGALWFKSTDFGDDKDRVLIKSDGKKTYIAVDLAYHRNKIGRGFSKIINIQGADHHKEADVIQSFIENILGEKNKFYPILTQFVRVLKDGKEVKMSKRKGTYYALDDLIDEVGKDAVRFIFSSYAPGSHINFDIDLAKERSEKNPVYYVQYAHARICSILSKVPAQGWSVSGGKNQKSKIKNSLSLLTHPKELSLIREMDRFPELIEEISESYEVHKLPHYAIKLADKFHSFYGEVRVIDEGNPELSGARLNLVNAVRIVLSETLRLIGVNAPEKM